MTLKIFTTVSFFLLVSMHLFGENRLSKTFSEEFCLYDIHQSDAVSKNIIGEKKICNKRGMKKKEKQGALPGETSDLRILSYNIWCGFDYPDSSKGKDGEREKRCIDFIRSLSPNVVALQELNDFTQEKLEKTAKAWGHDYAVLLKENGYPVGITSDKPIALQAKIVDPLWHGLLHVKTWNIDFFVLHLSPSDDHCWRYNEAEFITTYMAKTLGKQDQYIVLGDFNAHSPFDSDFYKKQNPELKLYERKNENRRSVSLPFKDFAAVSRFLSFPTVDVCERYVDPSIRYSYPTIIYAPERPKEESLASACRIDYILVSPSLSNQCVGAAIIHSAETELLSDHYPVTADFVRTESLSHTKIPYPVAARYCFKNFQIGNFGNALGLPMVPFRTDDFDLMTGK